MAIDLPARPSEHDIPEAGRSDGGLFPIVGIGASAGGLEAVMQLLAELPEKPGMAFVLVQHLDPKHESRLSEVLAKKSRMPVAEATHSMPVEPDHVYVIPPGAIMTIALGQLLVTPRGDGHAPNVSVDTFFKSLASHSRSRAVGVVLSGTGSDGTLGLMEIKAEGGVTFAQDETTAKHHGMPRSAIETGCVDFVMPPQEIAGELVRISRHPYLARAPVSAIAPPAKQEDESDIKRVLALVRAATGVDFNHYRDTTIRRRILRRMMLHTKHDLGEYADLLERDRGEIQALYRDLLINVTGFFRDQEVFEALSRVVFPEIVKGKSVTAPVRIWVPGCSTGQEAYSIAIALTEFLDSKMVRPPIQIFATDLGDQASLDRARLGVYPESIEAEVSPERLRRFFTKDDHSYRIDKTIRDICVFARQNIAADPPFSRVDMISCRNVLIYLSPTLQKRVIPTFHYALNIPGFLVLGSAETVGQHTDLFDIEDRTLKIYSKKPVSARPYPLYSSAEASGYASSGEPKPSRSEFAPPDFQREADRLLLGRYTPPSVLVDENFDVIQFRGKTGPYLEPPIGEPTTNVLKLAREGLFLKLRDALQEAKQQNHSVRASGIRIRDAEVVRDLHLEVVPIAVPGGPDAAYLVLFSESASEPPDPDAAGDTASSISEGEILRLRQELTATKEYLQSLIEQQDVVNQELRSANEEVQSSNEELQSTNEELETAKEELQSTNEELTTVNEQLQHRNAELALLNNDLTHLLTSTTVPVMLVGADLRIRRFTSPAKRVMNLLPTDIGRAIADIRVPLEVPDLEGLITEVIEAVRPIEREVRDLDGHWYAMRLYPYRGTADRIDGAVIILFDIHQAKRAQEILQAQSVQLMTQATLLDLSKDAIIVMDGERRILSWNRGAEEMYGWTREEAIHQLIHELLKTRDWQTTEEMKRSGSWEGELRQSRKDGQEIIVQSRQVVVRGTLGEGEAILEINRDITARLLDEALLREQAGALRQADRRKDEFLAMLAHELRNPLAPVRNAVRILRLAGDNVELVAPALDVLERQAEQLSRIVDDLLDMTRIAEGKIELRKERVKLSAIVQTAVESCRSLIETRGHELTMNFPAEPLYLEADPVRVAQILINLLNNAAKFTESNGKIALTIEREPGPRNLPGSVVIRVKDDGMGIAPELLPRVFDMFVQGDQSLERVRGGLGVGLTLVRSLAQAHGGSVEARSEGMNQGSEFLVRLPLSTPPRAGSEEAVPPAKPRRIPRRILVVDDNQDQAESLGMLLEVFGHQVRIAFDGANALEAAQSFSPQAILLDIGLPGMNGYDLARRIRQMPQLQHVLLIAQTGWGEDDDRRRSTEAGFDRHLVKPVDIQVLEKLLEDLES